MSLEPKRTSSLMRVPIVLFLMVGVILSGGNIPAAHAQNTSTDKPISNIAQPNTKTVKKHSLRRIPAKRRLKTKSTRRYRGLHPRLRLLLSTVRRHYGRPVIILSGCRSRKRNRLIGGAKRSMHLRCMAADIKVAGVSKSRLRRYLVRLSGRGGVGTYCGRSIVHLDVGPKRTWHHGCRKRKRRSRKS